MTSPTSSISERFSTLSLRASTGRISPLKRTASFAQPRRFSLLNSAPELASARQSRDQALPLIEAIIARKASDKHLLLSHVAIPPDILFKTLYTTITESENDHRRTNLLSFCSEWITLFAHTKHLIEASDSLAGISVQADQKLETRFQNSINHIDPPLFRTEPIKEELQRFLQQTPSSNQYKQQALVLRKMQLATREQLRVSEIVQYALTASLQETPVLQAMSEFDTQVITVFSCPDEQNKQPQFFETALKLSKACMKEADFATPWAIYEALKPYASSLKQGKSKTKYEQLEKAFGNSCEIFYDRLVGKQPICLSAPTLLERLNGIRSMSDYVSEEKMILNYDKLNCLWLLATHAQSSS